MLTPFPMDFPHTPVTPQHAVIIDDDIIIGRRRVYMYCARTFLWRRVCKRVDVYIITLLCTWWIYALSERLPSFALCAPKTCVLPSDKLSET